MKNKPYREPVDFFPKELRKEFKLGEYSEEAEEQRKREKEENKKANDQIRNYVNRKQK